MVDIRKLPGYMPSTRSIQLAVAMAGLYAAMTLPTADAQTIRAYAFAPPDEEARITLIERAQPEPGPNEVLIDVHAVSLNRRDLSIADSGRYRGGDAVGTVALSDGAGEVVAVPEHLSYEEAARWNCPCRGFPRARRYPCLRWGHARTSRP